MSTASWLTSRRIQSQLLLWTALILIASVAFTGEVRTRYNIHLLQQNLKDRSETLVNAVNQALGLPSSNAANMDLLQLEKRLAEFVEADRTLTRMDLLMVQDDVPFMLATSSVAGSPILADVPNQMTTEITQVGDERVMVTALPVPGTGFVLVAMSSMENILRYEEFNRSLTPVFAGVLILTNISLMYFMYRKTLSRRFDELLEGIRRAKEGQGARIPDARDDEIGIIAKTLNSLLEQVRSFNDELQRRISRATEDLNKRNLALEETTRQMVSMQHQLLQSERLATVGQMAATFAHEIGSPMSSLSAHVQLILEDPRLSDDQRETLLIIREQIHAVVQIVNDLLRSARRGPSDFVLTDINEILRTVIRLVGPKLMSQRIEVRTDLRPLPFVRGYPLYIQEAFLNIINNASEAMPAGGRLELNSWFDEETQRVNIRVVDNGPGIDPSAVERMFDRFVTTKAIGKGTGLGLVIVKEIVDSHRGTVRVAPGEEAGTSAHITFPVETSAVRAS